MMIIVLVKLAIELVPMSAFEAVGDVRKAYQVQDRNFHHTLIEVCCSVLYYFDGYDFLRLQILTLDDLPKCTLPEYIEY